MGLQPSEKMSVTPVGDHIAMGASSKYGAEIKVFLCEQASTLSALMQPRLRRPLPTRRGLRRGNKKGNTRTVRGGPTPPESGSSHGPHCRHPLVYWINRSGLVVSRSFERRVPDWQLCDPDGPGALCCAPILAVPGLPNWSAAYPASMSGSASSARRMWARSMCRSLSRAVA